MFRNIHEQHILSKDMVAWRILSKLKYNKNLKHISIRDIFNNFFVPENIENIIESPFIGVVKSIYDNSSVIMDAYGNIPRYHSELLVLPEGFPIHGMFDDLHRNPSSQVRMRIVNQEKVSILNVGQILCDSQAPAALSDMFSLNVLWLGEEALYAGRTYLISSLAGDFDGLVGKLKNRISPDTFAPLACNKLARGELGQVEIELNGPLVFDTQERLSPLSLLLFKERKTGNFLGIGFIRFELRRASNIHWQQLEVDKNQRAAALGQKPLVLWFTGLSGCGKSSVASLLEKRLHAMGKHTYVLDGDNIRHGLCKDLGFTKADRIENMRRITEVAKLMVDAGLIVLVTFISPFREERRRAREAFEADEFIEIFVDTPLETCEARDIKGLYAKARAGLIKNFTGIDSPYEPPDSPDIHLHGHQMSVRDMVESILEYMQRNNHF